MGYNKRADRDEEPTSLGVVKSLWLAGTPVASTLLLVPLDHDIGQPHDQDIRQVVWSWGSMEQRRATPEYILEVFADPMSVKEVVKGILHTIFFHRFFPSIRPKTRDVLDLTLPVVEDVELETLIDQKTAALVRQLDSSSDMGARITGVRGQIAVQFFEKRRRKAWFTKGEEEVCWEQWTLDVTLATPRTESGELVAGLLRGPTDAPSERAKVRKAMETMLLRTAMKIVSTVNREKDHIPPITTSEANPFPYQISINPKGDGWGARMGIF